MIKKFLAGFALLALLAGQPAMAYDRDAFCLGFEEGYKTIKGENIMMPMCPMEPMTPMGSTPFREGIKAGIAKGLKS